MTPSSPSSWSSTVASLRKASDGRLAGGCEAPAHLERYVNLLFRLTVAHKDSSIRLSRPAASSTAWVLAGGYDLRGGNAIRPTDGRYLRLVALLELDVGTGRQLRFQALTWQYQTGADDDSWVFRADYSRARSVSGIPPRGHLHIDGTLRHPSVLGPKQSLGRVHFPCRRPTLEAAVVLLADELGVPTNAPHEVWRAALAEHEAQSVRLFDP
jgi:hypothetical protein